MDNCLNSCCISFLCVLHGWNISYWIWLDLDSIWNIGNVNIGREDSHELCTRKFVCCISVLKVVLLSVHVQVYIGQNFTLVAALALRPLVLFFRRLRGTTQNSLVPLYHVASSIHLFFYYYKSEVGPDCVNKCKRVTRSFSKRPFWWVERKPFSSHGFNFLCDTKKWHNPFRIVWFTKVKYEERTERSSLPLSLCHFSSSTLSQFHSQREEHWPSRFFSKPFVIPHQWATLISEC